MGIPNKRNGFKKKEKTLDKMRITVRSRVESEKMGTIRSGIPIRRLKSIF